MGLLRWFDTADAIAFANSVAEKVVRLIPLAGQDAKSASRKRSERFERILGETFRAQTQKRFNFYQKAKFANTLKWTLMDQGYSTEFADEFVRVILTRMR